MSFHFRQMPPLKNLLLKTPFILSSSFSTFAVQNPFYRKTFPHIFQECSKRKAHEPGRQAHARMIVSAFNPTVIDATCLLHMYIKCSCLESAVKVFDRMSERSCVSWTAMIYGYSINGEMGFAQSLFDLMPERNVISWTSLISGYLQNGNCLKSVEVFVMMGRNAVAYNEITFSVVLKACGILKDCVLGQLVHGALVKCGFECEVATATAMVDVYAKCNMMDESLRFFDAMPVRTPVSWSAIVAGCVQNDDLEGGLELFKEMLREGIAVSQSVYASVFKSCAGLSDSRLGSQLHGHALKSDFGADTIVGSAIVNMYANCDNLLNATKVFNLLPNPNLQSYTALILGYARGGRGIEGLLVFMLLLKSDLGFDEISLSVAFSACAVSNGLVVGTQIHGLAIKTPFHDNVYVATAILNMYVEHGAFPKARRIFDEMRSRNVVSWNSIIATCEQNKNEETLSLFAGMLRSRMEPDEFTYATVLNACARGQALQNGMEIHGRVIMRGMGLDSVVNSVIVDMYCKCRMVDEAEKLHERMEEQTLVSWNAMIHGYSSIGRSERAHKCFSRMLETGIKPDKATYATVLNICSDVANLELGKQIHAQIIKQRLQSHVYIISTLVDMYSKCGNMQDSILMFQKSSKHDVVTWTSMVCAYARHGNGNEALQVFKEMLLEKVMPNHVTFTGVLHACAHNGLVDEALHYLYVMHSEYGVLPVLNHYACVVDALGRCGRIIDALKLIDEMPFKANDVIWISVLGNCKMHRNVKVAEIAARSLLQLDPQNSTAYVLLSQIYVDAGMWDEASEMRRIMMNSRVKKVTGSSRIVSSSI